MTNITGHIRKRTYHRNDRSWTRFVATLEIDESGQERVRRSQSFERERAARTWLAEQRALAAVGVRVERGVPLLGEVLQSWLAHGREVKAWSPTHARRSAEVVSRDLAPLHGVPIDRLTTDQIEDLFARRRAAGLSPDSIRLIRAALSAALNLAIRRRQLPPGHNVARLAQGPELRPHVPQFLSPEEAARLLTVLQAERLGALFGVSMLLALRPSEAIGLRWADVDLERREVHLTQAIQREGSQYLVLPLKTERSARTIALPEIVAELLRRHRLAQLEARVSASGWDDSGLVFTNTHGGPVHESAANRVLSRVLGRAGIAHVKFYELRHTGATAMLALGVPLEQIQETLGHTSINTTRRYAKLLEPARRQAAARMDAFFSGSLGGTTGGTKLEISQVAQEGGYR